MNDTPLVFVIVVNYNGLNYLKTCLSSFEQQTYSNYKIIVFDNASTDNSAEFLKQNFPKIKLIQAKSNLGFAEGNNLAIKFALGQNAEYVFLVNNDTEAEEDLIEKLIVTCKNDESIGIVGPAVFDLENKRSIQEMGMSIDRFGYPLALKNKHDFSHIFFVSGCAMMIKSELIRTIGSFDEKYFMFAEDLDLCWRAQLAGCKIAVNDHAKIYHASGGSISGGVVKESAYKTNIQRIFLREKNTLRTLIKNYGILCVVKTVPFYVSLLLFESIFWVSLLKSGVSRNVLKAIFWNIKVLPDTFQQRAHVQSLRRIKDSEINKKMVRGYCKFSIFRAVGVPDFTDPSSNT
jgi:GT2 family glycosyltransferase